MLSLASVFAFTALAVPPFLPYLTPSPRTTRDQQNCLYTYLLPGTVPARYASRSPAGIRILSYKLFFPILQHSKLFFLSPLHQTNHTNRDKTVGGLRYRRCTVAARGKKKEKEKGSFSPLCRQTNPSTSLVRLPGSARSSEPHPHRTKPSFLRRLTSVATISDCAFSVALESTVFCVIILHT